MPIPHDWTPPSDRPPQPVPTNLRSFKKILQAKDDRKAEVRDVVAQFLNDVLLDVHTAIGPITGESVVLSLLDLTGKPLVRLSVHTIMPLNVETACSAGKWEARIEVGTKINHRIAEHRNTSPMDATSQGLDKAISCGFTVEDVSPDTSEVVLRVTVHGEQADAILSNKTERRERPKDSVAEKVASSIVRKLGEFVNDGWPVVDLSKVLA